METRVLPVCQHHRPTSACSKPVLHYAPTQACLTHSLTHFSHPPASLLAFFPAWFCYYCWVMTQTRSQMFLLSALLCFIDRFTIYKGQELCTDWRIWETLDSHLCGPPVLPAGCDVGDDTGVALFAHIDAVHFNDALAWVKAGDCCNCAFWQRETETCQSCLENFIFVCQNKQFGQTLRQHRINPECKTDRRRERNSVLVKL